MRHQHSSQRVALGTSVELAGPGFSRPPPPRQAGEVGARQAKSGAEPRPEGAYPRAAICSSAALRSTVGPEFSTDRSKGFQTSPTTCS